MTQDNLELFDFELREEDMKKINKLDKNTPFHNQTDMSLRDFVLI